MRKREKCVTYKPSSEEFVKISEQAFGVLFCGEKLVSQNRIGPIGNLKIRQYNAEIIRHRRASMESPEDIARAEATLEYLEGLVPAVNTSLRARG